MDRQKCSKDVGLLAAAAPCATTGGKRPISARLIICPHNPLWGKFQSARDVFLHELMHALGFGLIIPKDDRDVGHNRTFIWRYETTGEMITTYFMDFQRIALRYAREHFGCAQLQGIESEDQKKIHLSEYLKMQKKIVYKNICRSWYKTNVSFVIAETKAYWYGHKWGCEFVQGSCFDFIATRSQRR
ncbi:unnamed protein product [Toxocara canis]|uniref:Leishmanolysin-like peptidase n=1 Tax=Toxocara canis TaxID=6265 RepID=A0A183U1E3_TOXCA|nr:unnamed protein product [Toxocara canis]